MTNSNTAPATSTASDVRAWSLKNLPKVPDVAHKSINGRGRPHPEAVAVFNRFHSKRPYMEGTPKAEKTIKVKVPVKGADGRTRTRVVSVTASEVRSFKGHPAGKRGKIAKADLTEYALTRI